MTKKLLNTSKIRLFIEQVIHQELEEAAITAAQATASELALFVQDNASEKFIVLYRPSVLETDTTLSADDKTSALKVVVGMIRLIKNKRCNLWIVQNSAADKGYGPFMYDVAFSLVGSIGMAPDRDTIKQAAKNLWSYNFTTRTNEFVITPIKDCLFQGDKKAGEEFLDYRYVLKTPVDVQTLIKNHQKCVGFIRNLHNPNFLEPEEVMKKFGNDFFGKKYGLP